MIYYDKVTKAYNGGTPAVSDVTLSVDPGEFVSIVGHSGAGKTTLLKLLFAEIKPTTGSVYFGSQEVHLMSQAELLNFQIEGGKLTGELLESEREVKVKMANLQYVLGREKGKLQGQPEEISRTSFNTEKITQAVVLEKAMEKNFGLKASQAMRDAASDKNICQA